MSNVGKKESIPMQNTHDLLVGTLSSSIVIQRVALFDPDAFRIVIRFIAYANFFRGTSQQKMKHVKFIFKKEIMN